MTKNDGLVLDVYFTIRFKVTNFFFFFDKEEKISHPRPTQESHREPKCMQW